MLAAVLAAFAVGAPPPRNVSVDAWGQADRAAEVVHAPLRLFRRPRRAGDALPPPSGLMLPLGATATRMRAGTLQTPDTRRVETNEGTVYLAPTSRRWICMETPHVQTCHRGLLRQRVTWGFYTTNPGVAIFGIAADDVARVTLAWGGHRTQAELHDNVFTVHRPFRVKSPAHLPPLGRLLVEYRDRPTAVVLLR